MLLESGAFAAAPPANLLLFDSDPFLFPSAQVVGSALAPDWTSLPSGLPATLQYTVERFTQGSGLVSPTLRTFAPLPAGGLYPMVNQQASDISFCNLSAPAAPRPLDLDGNGLPDDWEMQHFGRTGVDPNADSDGDGFSNLAEYEAGTDPNSAASFPAIDGLISRWSGEDSPADSVGQHSATWKGKASYADGKFGRALSLDGASYLSVADAPDLRLSSGLTLAAWIRLDSLTCNRSPILTRPGSQNTNPAYGLWVDCQGPRLVLGTAFAQSYNGPSINLATGVWYHVAFAWDGTDVRGYLNGRLAFGYRVSAGFGPLDLVEGKDLLLGFDGNTGFFKGSLDEVVIANRALNGTEIEWLAGGNSGPRGAVSDGSILVELADETVWRVRSDGTDPQFLTHGYDARLSSSRESLLFRRGNTEPGQPNVEELWQRDLVTGDEVSLSTFPASRDAISFDWASDDQALVIADSKRGKIERWEIPSGDVTLLLDTTVLGFNPSELFCNRQDGNFAFFANTPTVATSAPWLMDADGGNPRMIPGTQVNDFSLHYGKPVLSPDGQWVVVKSGHNLVKMHSDGTQATSLPHDSSTSGPLIVHDTQAAWTADGGTVVTVASASGSGPDARLIFVPIDLSSAPQELFIPGAPLVAVPFCGSAPGAANVDVQIGFIPAAENGDSRLEIDVPSRGSALVLEAAETLDSLWQAVPADLHEENGRRWLEIPASTLVSARFYRVRYL